MYLENDETLYAHIAIRPVRAAILAQNCDIALIGDTKSGSIRPRCDNSHYTKVVDWFNSFDTGLIYSPGDNEWADCLRTNNGAYDSLDRLALVRKTYYQTNRSLGRRPVTLSRQREDPKYALYLENAMLVEGPVVLGTVHAIGSINNLKCKLVQGVANKFYDNDIAFTARNEANIVWPARFSPPPSRTNLLAS